MVGRHPIDSKLLLLMPNDKYTYAECRRRLRFFVWWKNFVCVVRLCWLETAVWVLPRKSFSHLDLQILFTKSLYNSLLGGWPTPLKNDGVRQLGWWHSQYYMEKYTKNVPNHQSVILNMEMDHFPFKKEFFFHTENRRFCHVWRSPAPALRLIEKLTGIVSALL